VTTYGPDLRPRKGRVTPRPIFPFSAVVGQDDVKLALLLNAIDRRIGGVVLRGEKGSAKSTLARGLSALLPGEAPFVDLPVSATEDRVVGSLDLESALTSGEKRFHPGLLAEADNGVLYIDEINLLPDHLVDVLLDVAASGVNRVERESMSESHPSRFVLIGSMNPEEGELRPQLLDRFGLAVDAVSSPDPAERVEAVQRRMDFDKDPDGFARRWSADDDALAERLAGTTSGEVPPDLLLSVSQLCVAMGCEGLRADLVIARAAAALAGWEGRSVATVEDVRRVAPLALAHRRRRSPFDGPGIERDEIDRTLDSPPRDRSDRGPGEEADSPGGERGPSVPADVPTRIVPLSGSRTELQNVTSGRRTTVESPRGRMIGDRVPQGGVTDVAVAATVRSAALRVAAGAPTGHPPPGPVSTAEPLVRREDLRQAVREEKAGNLLILVVDASASMAVERRMGAVKGAVLSLLLDAYQRRDRVAVITFGGEDAEVVLRPTGSMEIARARLTELATGGRTPLAAGLQSALRVAEGAPASHQPLLILISDGRATSAPDGHDPLEIAMTTAAIVRQRAIPALVLDVEDGHARLGLAAQLAEAMGARYLPLTELSAGAMTSAIREGLQL
jgi:magnesium chelatase subunit D